jgi:hypothetical protein
MVRSRTPLFAWVELCHYGGCDESIWDYIDKKTGHVDESVPPPEYVPGMPRTDIHKTRRPGPYRTEKPAKKPRKAPAKVLVSAGSADGWDTDW